MASAKRSQLRGSDWTFRPQTERLYLAFYKPFGILSQFTEEPGSKSGTLKEFDFPENVYPVGRLDADSEGLLLLTDDRRLNHRLLDPAWEHDRTYLVQVENIPSPERLRLLAEGVEVKGARTRKARAHLLKCEPDLPARDPPIRFRQTVPTAWIELTLREGKNRQVRRMTAAIDHPTLRLVRSAIGQLRLTDLGLNPGQWRRLTNDELKRVFAPSSTIS